MRFKGLRRDQVHSVARCLADACGGHVSNTASRLAYLRLFQYRSGRNGGNGRMTVINRTFLHRTAAIFALVFVLTAASATSEAAAKVAVVAFGLFGDQSVFESEARAAARIIATRFDGGQVVVRANTKTRKDATPETLAGALRSVARTVDPEQDILFLMLTSHGSRDGLTVKAGSRNDTLSPAALSAMLAFTGVRHRVVILSACYSGVFIPALAGPDTLVITAADADHPSFGCKDGAKRTYFGEAFFNAALRQPRT